MLHHGTPSTPNHLPYLFLFEFAGFSFAPSWVIEVASASCPRVLAVRAIGAGWGGTFAVASSARVRGPTTPSISSWLSRWKARTAPAVATPYAPSSLPGA